MKGHHGAARIGRLAPWQRRFSHATLGACAITGLVWFVALDGFELQPPKLLFWWISHGVCGFLALLVIGAVLPQHITSSWRHHRNRWLGAISLAALAVLGVSAVLLLYGSEGWRPASHWIHVGVGVAATVVFPWHVIKGRRSIGKTIAKPVPERAPKRID